MNPLCSVMDRPHRSRWSTSDMNDRDEVIAPSACGFMIQDLRPGCGLQGGPSRQTTWSRVGSRPPGARGRLRRARTLPRTQRSLDVRGRRVWIREGSARDKRLPDTRRLQALRLWSTVSWFRSRLSETGPDLQTSHRLHASVLKLHLKPEGCQMERRLSAAAPLSIFIKTGSAAIT